MSKFRNEFLGLINNLRKDPTFIIKDLEEQMKFIDNQKVLRLPGKDCGIQLRDGVKGYEDVINILKTIQPEAELTLNPYLNAISKEYLAEIVKANDNEVPPNKFEEILEKYGRYSGNLYSLSEFGGDSPKQVLINLLVQDGREEKTNAVNLTKKNFKELGLSFAAHGVYGFCTFILMVTRFKSKEEIEKQEEEKKQYTVNPQETMAPTESVPQTVNVNLRGQQKQLPIEVDPDMTEGVVSFKKREKVIEIKGIKYIVVETVKIFEDGSKETEKIREPLDGNKVF